MLRTENFDSFSLNLQILISKGVVEPTEVMSVTITRLSTYRLQSSYNKKKKKKIMVKIQVFMSIATIENSDAKVPRENEDKPGCCIG